MIDQSSGFPSTLDLPGQWRPREYRALEVDNAIANPSELGKRSE